MEKIRTFIAVPLSAALQSEIEKLTGRLRPLSRGVRWMRPESIHLTLKFLGELTEAQLEEVFAAADEAVNGNPQAFQLTAAGTGAFPHFKRPRVLWIGIGGKDLPLLLNLQKQLEERLADRGFARETRSFSPHLTLGRVKFPGRLEEMLNVFRNDSFDPVSFPVEQLQVMRSDLKPSGAVYRVQRSFELYS
ncbi:MAG: RNA 2',3'-cyclic phosphodiesterase [Calditrichia bacterium]